MIDLANEFRDRTGMPSDLVRRILDRARGLQQQLLGAGESSRELLGSASSALDQLVITLLDLGETDAALEAAKGSYAVARRVVNEENPTDPDWRRTLSVALNKIGLVSMRAGRREEAIAAYQGIARDHPGGRRHRSRQVALAERRKRHGGAPRPGAQYDRPA